MSSKSVRSPETTSLQAGPRLPCRLHAAIVGVWWTSPVRDGSLCVLSDVTLSGWSAGPVTARPGCNGGGGVRTSWESIRSTRVCSKIPGMTPLIRGGRTFRLRTWRIGSYKCELAGRRGRHHRANARCVKMSRAVEPVVNSVTKRHPRLPRHLSPRTLTRLVSGGARLPRSAVSRLESSCATALVLSATGPVPQPCPSRTTSSSAGTS